MTALLLAGTLALLAQRTDVDFTVEAPASLAAVADRVRAVDRDQLAGDLARAGLAIPSPIVVTLIPESDPRAGVLPVWVVGLALGSRDIVIFPERIGRTPDAYPYDSLDAVIWHEVVHLALAAQAGDRPLPRWFHEGVAMNLERGWGVGSQIELLFATASSPGVADLRLLFESETRPETARGYLLAAALVADVRQRHGLAIPGAIARRVAQGASFADAFLRETGETPDAAAALAWQPYQRWSSWLPIVASPSTLWFGIMALAFLAFAATMRRRRQRRRQWEQEEGPEL